MLRRLLQDNINTFNKNWNKTKKLLIYLPNYVEQFMYIYDDTKIYQENNGYDNLELYSELMQRLDISHLRMQWVRLDDDSCFFLCIFKEKNDWYLEYKTNGVHKKVWLLTGFNFFCSMIYSIPTYTRFSLIIFNPYNQ